MGVIIARTYSGGRDLFYAVPNLLDAKITNIIYEKNNDDYITELVIEDVDGLTHKLFIKQEIQ